MARSFWQRQTRLIGRRVHSWWTVARLTLEGRQTVDWTAMQRAPRPLLMIYGFGATQRTLAVLENRLKNEGYQVFSFGLGDWGGTINTWTIEQSAEAIHHQVEALYKRCKIKAPLTVIGHSKGGIIATHYLKCFAPRRRVQTLITVGAPHQGTPWAAVGAVSPLRWPFPSLTQLAPGSAFLKSLADQPFPPTCQVYSLYSRADVVCPFPCCVLDGHDPQKVVNVELPRLSHSELLIKRSVFDALRHILRHDVPSSWIEASANRYRAHRGYERSL